RARQDGHPELQPVPPRLGADAERGPGRYGSEPMNVSGERRFDAPRSTVWQVLNDPAAMAQTMPGVESFDVADERHGTAHVKRPLGRGGLRLSVSIDETEEREPQ